GCCHGTSADYTDFADYSCKRPLTCRRLPVAFCLTNLCNLRIVPFRSTTSLDFCLLLSAYCLLIMSVIQADFDRLALLDAEGWTHNNHYHNFLLPHIRHDCQNALEVGCGTGAFARLLAARARHVVALDLSPEMIRVA